VNASYMVGENLYKVGEINHSLAPMQTDAEGGVDFVYSNKLSMLRVQLSLEGFADLQLAWRPQRGLTIPPEYNVMMSRATRIGGFVMDDRGTPLADTMVQLHLPDSDSGIALVESFACELRVTTDANGHWESTRVARELLERIEGAPWRTDFLPHGWLRFSEKPQAVARLIDQSFVFTLRPGLEVRGMILDLEGLPCAGARITLGNYFSNQRSTTSSVSGDFVIRGAVSGREIITAFDERKGIGFKVVDVATNAGPFVVTLEPFRDLRLRTVNRDGNPVTNVEVKWNPVGQHEKTSNGADGIPTAQYHFQGSTGSEGILRWSEAPADTLLVSLFSKRHSQLHDVLVRADGAVQTVVLDEMFPPQIIRGTIRDAQTGASVSPARFQEGYPRTRPGRIMEPVWYGDEMHRSDFAGGRFELEFENSANEDPKMFERIFKVSAPGYEPAVTRIVRGNEGDVDLDITLQRSTSAPPGSESKP